jgi:hypothetical protein
MRVKGWFGMPTKSGKSVKIKFSSFDNSEYNVDLAWLKKWGMETELRAGFNEMKKIDLIETYGETCIPPSSSTVVNQESVSSPSGLNATSSDSATSSVTPSARKRRRRATPTPPQVRMPSDDESLDGEEDEEMTAEQILEVPTGLGEEEPAVLEFADDLDPDLTFECGPGLPKISPEFTGEIPQNARESDKMDRFRGPPGEILEGLLKPIILWVLWATNINAGLKQIAPVTIEEFYILIALFLMQAQVHLPGVRSYFYPDPLYAELGFQFPDVKEKIGGWARYNDIMKILRFENYDDPEVDKSRKSFKVHRMVEKKPENISQYLKISWAAFES